MTKNQIVTLIVFVLYMIAMVAVGAIFAKKGTTSQKEYAIGNRSLNPWVTALSAQASDMSGWLLMGLPGLVFVGTKEAKSAIFTALGLLIGTILNWYLLAKRFRVYTEVAGDSITVPQYLIRRFYDDKKIMGLVSGAIILIFFTVYTASMFAGGAKIFNRVFGLNYRLGLFIGATIIVLYTFLGGFKAVAWTDLVQGIVMFLAIIVVPLIVLGLMSKEQVSNVGKYISDSINNSEYTVSNAISDMAWGLGYFGMPHIIVRFMAIKDKKLIKPARIVALIWVTISLIAAIFVGFVGHEKFIHLLNKIDEENIFIIIVQSKEIYVLVSAILLTGVLAAIMSTADSQLLVASTSFSSDIYKTHIRKKGSDKEILSVNRIVLIIVSLIAAFIALDPNSSVFKLVSYAWAGFGSSLGPVILFSLYFKNITKWAAMSSMITGFSVSAIFYVLKEKRILDIYEIIPGFLSATLVLFIVSYITKKTLDKRIIEDFNLYIEKLKEGTNRFKKFKNEKAK